MHVPALLGPLPPVLTPWECACLGAHTCALTWRPEDNHGGISWKKSTLGSLSLSLTQESYYVSQAGLELTEICCLDLPSAGCGPHVHHHAWYVDLF